MLTRNPPMHLSMSYKLFSICVCNTKMLKLLPFLFTHITHTCYERCTPWLEEARGISLHRRQKLHLLPQGSMSFPSCLSASCSTPSGTYSTSLHNKGSPDPTTRWTSERSLPAWCCWDCSTSRLGGGILALSCTTCMLLKFVSDLACNI